MNPKLVGYALGDGSSFSKQAQFNMAFNGAMDQDLMQEARRLMNKMERDPRIDLKNNWKVCLLIKLFWQSPDRIRITSFWNISLQSFVPKYNWVMNDNHD